MKRRIIAITMLALFLLGVSLMVASFFSGNNNLMLVGLGMALPIGIAVMIFKAPGPESHDENEQNDEEHSGEDALPPEDKPGAEE